MFDRPVFLPHKDPHTAGWHVKFLEEKEPFLDFQKRLIAWLKEIGFSPKERQGNFLAHVTIARQPFVLEEWKDAFFPLPLYLKNIHLLESLGQSHYEIKWSYPLSAPFESIEHTADVAFLIRGENFDQLYIHAALALAFDFPHLIRYVKPCPVQNLDELIAALNNLVAAVDVKEGCPFKAVSFHSEISQTEKIWEWEMIVDV